jgi:SNF2 family DNA or RNA helicase
MFGRGTIKVHRFFLPELVYILGLLPGRHKFGFQTKTKYAELINLILEKTWMKRINQNFSNRVKSGKFSEFNYTLKPYQKEFIQIYDEKKQKYNLNGYILSFEQGLGKTFTSIALMHGLEKDAIIVIAPKSTIRTVWKNEIETVFKQNQDIWVVGEKPKKARFYITNYESIDKLKLVLKYVVQSKNVGIIVDESHNFKNVGAQRVIRLLAFAKAVKCQDTLLMSGTPIKALGSEMVPSLQLIDPFFDDMAQKIFLNAFGVKTSVALDILKNRLGMVMHRKMKSEVLKLPSKTHKEIKVKVPGSDKYTLVSVKDQVLAYMKKRQKFYEKNKKFYHKEYWEVIDALKEQLKDDATFEWYLDVVRRLQEFGYNTMDKYQVEEVARANKYEKDVLRPLLTNEQKKKFDRSKSVVKYVQLKIMGEVLGGLLNKLRAEMFAKMVQKSPICEIIEKSAKKTVCFSTYVDVVKSTADYVTSSCNKKDPILIFGETSSAVTSLLKLFKEDTTRNPLIATIQTLSTGVTLVEANTVIFLNQPWRSTDRSQAEDRVHRIGQDTDVFIYNLVLDTGGKPNLSTRMEDIIDWSQKMFEGIVGKEDYKKELKPIAKRLMR